MNLNLNPMDTIMNLHRLIALLAISTLILAGCGETDDDSPNDHTQQRSGLDADPLSGLDLGDPPDLNDVPDDMQSIVEEVKEWDEEMLWFFGEHTENDDSEVYTWRADIEPMNHLSDDAFEVATDILAKRNDITSVSEVPLETNGGYGGDGEYWQVYHSTIVYDADADAEPSVDVNERIEAMEDEIDAALESNGQDPEYDDDGLVKATLYLDWNARWYHHVDVFDEDEVESTATAMSVGEQRAEEKLEDQFDDLTDHLADIAGCVEHDRSYQDIAVTYGCEEDDLYELTDVAEHVDTLHLVGSAPTTNGGTNAANGGENGDEPG